MSDATERVTSGQVWEDFCRMLQLAGKVLDRPGSPQDPFSRAEGYRYLTRIARAALETFVEHSDPRAPVLSRVVHETAKMGSDNPDNHYMSAAVDGAFAYRLVGTRGTVAFLSFATQRGHYGQGGGMPPVGQLEASDLPIGPDGTIEIHVGGAERDGAWLPLADGVGTLIVRQTFLDRASESPAELRIERVGVDPRPTPLTPERLDAGLAQAGRLVAGAAALFAGWAEGFARHTNELPQFDPATSTRFGGDPNIAYYHSYWALVPGEALVIEATPPRSDHWNFQVNNHWMESLDYRYHRIHVNKHTATYGHDGSVRVVVAHEDPGVPNWLTTDGHDRGTMCWRWIRAEAHPQPSTRVVPLASLRAGGA